MFHDGNPRRFAYTLKPDMRAQGVPPHWLLYVSVANADETAAKVAPAGGKVVAPPFDVMEFGRMAVFQDPAGATIAIWQSEYESGNGDDAPSRSRALVHSANGAPQL